jgi:hypothetical protein
LKSGKARSNAIIIQEIQEKSNKIMQQFDEVIDINPYEYISCKMWTTYNTTNKEIVIKAHSKYMEDYKLINLPGFKDVVTIKLGKIKLGKGEKDYSRNTLNEFICNHYKI